ncbi:DNA polymerase I [Bellilinea sp.]|uniref:DNA polymerase I n=1 Tax=Bellilinea sp. TaxID=2838785 RepID=UPI002ADE870E|nr:DNA polymerase I [Bellilinea sp.]
MPPILYLIDGHALAYRTYFAITLSGQQLTTSSGEPTAGIYGFASVLLRLLEQENPEYLAVAFDTGATFRNDLYAEYKATRAKMPDDLRPQIERIREMVDVFGFPRLEAEGFEADDVLGSIARQAAENGLGVKIITGDRDLLQLVNDRVIVNLAGSKLSEARDFGVKEVIETLGIRPEQVVDYKALVGDKSDNIPGVGGIGEKTAITLLQQYANLDDIYAHLDQIPTRVRTLLEKDREKAYLSRQLATIRTDLPVMLSLEKARTGQINVAGVEGFFQQLEFRSLLPRLKKLESRVVPAPSTGQQLLLFGEPLVRIGETPPQDGAWITVQTREALAELCRKLENVPVLSLDTETTSTDPMRAELVGLSLAFEAGQGYYLPVGHRTGEEQLPAEEVLKTLHPVLTSPQVAKIGHNLKYDALVLENQGVSVAPLTFDTMIAAWLVQPDSYNLGLKELAETYLGVQMTHIEELIGKGKNQLTMDRVPVSSVAAYAAADAEICLRLMPLLRERLEQVNAVRLFEEIEMPLVPVLGMMERNGVMLDVPFLQQMSHELTSRLFQIEKDIFQVVGYSFNLNSTQQLSKVLFETLKLEPPDRRKKTTSGHFSTSAGVLEELRDQHPVVEKILEYRELSKLKSTYVDALPQQINPRTGRVHTSYNQTGSVTGRLASSDPNLQNIPTRTETGRLVRNAFIAAPGYRLLSVDYSQIELRIVAHMAQDEAMLAAFRAGLDIHAATAAAIYGVELEQVTKEQRRHAKAINFGLIYGMSAFGLHRSTGLTLAEAENFVKAYFQQFPGVKAFLDGLRRQAARQGYVETLLGRRRYFPNLKSNANPALRAREEREAINAPVQGTAADIMKLAMVRLPPALKEAGLGARMLLQVHDELVLEVPENERDETVQVVRGVMENAYPLSIPLVTEARWGHNWGSLEVLP